MAGYIGSKASVVSSGAERKKTFTITGATTSLTGLNYTVGKVHVFQNGVRLVDGTDYTATNSTTITLTVAAQNGDNVVVISQASYQVALSGIDDQSNAVAMTIDSNENIGIGTSSPSKKAHLYASNDAASLRLENTANSKVWDITPARPGVANTGLSIYNVTDDRVDLHVDNSGNVGIGTSNPTNKLFVESSTVNNNTVFVKNTSGTGVNYGLEIAAGTNSTDHALHVTSSTGSSLLRVNGAGNVGIGTSSPEADLQIAKSSSASAGGAKLLLKPNGAYGSIVNNDDLGQIAFGAKTASIDNTDNDSVMIRGVADGTWASNDYPTRLEFWTTTDGVANPTERMRIDSSGRVTTPSQPAFQAYNTNNGAFGVNAGDTFPLNATHFNIGNCFNTSNYTFTAPVDGYYQLDFMTISTSSQTNIHLSFVFSGNSNMGYNFHFSGNASGGWDTLTMSGVYYMSAGVSVVVRNYSYGITVHGSSWNKFTGYLLG